MATNQHLINNRYMTDFDFNLFKYIENCEAVTEIFYFNSINILEVNLVV